LADHGSCLIIDVYVLDTDVLRSTAAKASQRFHLRRVCPQELCRRRRMGGNGPLRAAMNPAQDEHRSAVRAGHLHGKRCFDFILGRRGFDHGQGGIHSHFGQWAIRQARSCLKLQQRNVDEGT